MANTLQVSVVSAENEIFSGAAEYLIAPAINGEIGIFPNHIPLISKLKPGVLRMKLKDNQEQIVLAISGGFLEMQANKATVLADIVERAEHLDEEKLLAQKKQAEEKIKSLSSDLTPDIAHTYATLELAIAQLKALEFYRLQAKRA